jgi:hypothetical protein
MTKRFQLDWNNMQPLPRRKREGATVEDLAARKFNMGKAQHKGRCHITNQKRRQIALEARREKKVKNDQTKSRFHAYKAQVAAYWRGEREEHP